MFRPSNKPIIYNSFNLLEKALPRMIWVNENLCFRTRYGNFILYGPGIYPDTYPLRVCLMKRI